MRILMLLAVALALAPLATAAPAQATALPSLERALRDEINVTRARHGLSRLSASPPLQSAARAHSRAMLIQGFFAHRSADGTSMASRVKLRYGARGYVGWSVGENLLMASNEISAREAVELWLASPGHRRNLLDPLFRHVGISAIRRDSAPGVFGGEQTLVITLDLGTRKRTD